MQRMKYIVVKPRGNYERIYLFNQSINHNNFFNQQFYSRDELVSAGFVRLVGTPTGHHVLSCYGRSESLNVDSRPEADTELLVCELDGDPN